MLCKLKTRKSVRLRGYDYSKEGVYFITICSKDRECIFGQICVGTALAAVRNTNNIKLSELGNIIKKEWDNIPNQYKNVALDRYIIMPNHMHGILVINKRTGASPVPTISNIIGSFKSKTSIEYLKHVNENNLNISAKIWQRSFYDHIIWNDESLFKIQEYIRHNPSTWEEDQNNPSYTKRRVKSLGPCLNNRDSEK